MSSPSSLGGLKGLQWLFRAVEFGCSIVVLGIYSYYIVTLVKSGTPVPTSVRAVEAIAGIGTLYTILGVLFVCCCAGHPAPSFISMIFDIGLAGAFIYVAVANRAGAGSCSSSTFDPAGADATPGGGLPAIQQACQMVMVCLIVSCIASLFFLLSVPLEIKINRSRYRLSRPIRDADGEYITKSDHYGMPPQRRRGMRGFMGQYGLGRRAAPVANPDQLPAHQQWDDIQERRVEVPTWGDVSSPVDSDRLYFNDGASRDEHGPPPPPVRMKSTTAPRPAASVYKEGAVGDVEYGLYPEGEQSNDPRETGAGHRESKAARLARLEAA